jgi:hypothetical protein
MSIGRGPVAPAKTNKQSQTWRRWIFKKIAVASQSGMSVMGQTRLKRRVSIESASPRGVSPGRARIGPAAISAEWLA